MKKSDLSGASANIGEDAIKTSLVTSLDQILQGHAAGVAAVQTSGAPGSSSSIRVRGTATLNANTEPLYVIDGICQAGNDTKATPSSSIRLFTSASRCALSATCSTTSWQMIMENFSPG